MELSEVELEYAFVLVDSLGREPQYAWVEDPTPVVLGVECDDSGIVDACLTNALLLCLESSYRIEHDSNPLLLMQLTHKVNTHLP